MKGNSNISCVLRRFICKAYLIVGLLACFSFESKSQCVAEITEFSGAGGTYLYSVRSRYVTDTTFYTFGLDRYVSSAFSSSASYAWACSDGTSGADSSFTVAFTNDTTVKTIYLTLSEGACVAYDTVVFGASVIWNCANFSAAEFRPASSPCSGPFMGIAVFNNMRFGYIGPWATHFRFWWGDGDSSDAAFYGDTIDHRTLGLGLTNQYFPTHRYAHPGIYTIHATVTYINPTDGSTCTFRTAPQLAGINGRVPTMVLTGRTTYCVGDSLRLALVDTTAHGTLYDSIIAPGSMAFGYGYSISPAWSIPTSSTRTSFSVVDSIMHFSSLLRSDAGLYVVTMSDDICGTIDTYSTTITVDTLFTPTVTGSTTVCVGATSILTADLSGGSWSVDGTAAAIAGATLRGVMVGTDTVRYAVTNACGSRLASAPVSVVAPPRSGTITGTTATCMGTGTTLTATVSGGVWSSSATSVATINTAGGVTTVAAGTAVITYSVSNTCGTDDTTVNFTVYPLPAVSITSLGSASYSSGTIVMGCGELAVLSATGAAIHLWSGPGLSCTVCDTPIVNHAATATYSVTGTNTYGCTSTASYTLNRDRIIGHIGFTGTPPDTTDSKVWLIRFNTADSTLAALDSTTTCNDNGAPYYEFTTPTSGNYMVMAQLIYGNTPGTSGYIPTYGYSSSYWATASATTHSSGLSDSQNVQMLYGTVPSGTGFIGGRVVSGSGKGTATDIPVRGLLVFLKNATGAVLTYAYTDDSGNYQFNGLGLGDYVVFPTAFSYNTIASATISLSSTHSSHTGVVFKQFTTSRIIKPLTDPTALRSVTDSRVFSLFPNPTTGVLRLTWGNAISSNTSILFSDIAGRSLLQFDYNNLQNSSDIDLSALESGMYFYTIMSEGRKYSGKIVVAK